MTLGGADHSRPGWRQREAHTETADVAAQPTVAAPRRFAALRNRDCRPYLFGALLAMMADNIEHVITY